MRAVKRPMRPMNAIKTSEVEKLDQVSIIGVFVGS
jgi:hypothetical protein